MSHLWQTDAAVEALAGWHRLLGLFKSNVRRFAGSLRSRCHCRDQRVQTAPAEAAPGPHRRSATRRMGTPATDAHRGAAATVVARRSSGLDRPRRNRGSLGLVRRELVDGIKRD